MDNFPRAKTAVVGAATFGLGEAHGYSSMEMAAHAGVEALKMAGLRTSDVDALFICLPSDAMSGISLAEYYGIQPKITDNNRTGGSSSVAQMEHAALALEAGICDVALITYGSNQRSATGKLQTPVGLGGVESVYKPRNPVSSYALAAHRHMHEFGTTREQLAQVALSARQWAKLNPEAFEQGDLTLDDVLNSRMVSDPLTVRDCCLITDGAGAMVMTRADKARDICKKPAYLLGAAAATTHMSISSMPDLTRTAAVESGARAYAQAGVGAADIDVLSLYDAFTINVLLFLEDLGFCEKGEGGAFVSDGRIAPGGQLPVNTNGGGLSCCHPGQYGMFANIEAIRQVMGLADKRQINDVNLALAHTNGGNLSSQATAIFGSSSTV